VNRVARVSPVCVSRELLKFSSHRVRNMVSHQRVALCMCVCVQAGALEREVQAVDSEFKGVLQSDHSRLAQLMCHTVSERMR
jgi:hypothetical protein